MLETPCQKEQLGHTHMLAKQDSILYVHVCNIKLYFYLEFWIGQARETTNQVEVALHALEIHYTRTYDIITTSH